MARTPENYAHNKQLSTVASDVVAEVSTGVYANISKLSFYNSSSTENRSVTVYIVESGGSADTGNTAAIKSIPPLKTWNVAEVAGSVLSEGMTLQASQDSGGDVNANCSGANIT